MRVPRHGVADPRGIQENQPHRGFSDNLMKMFSRRVSNRSKRKNSEMWAQEKEMPGRRLLSAGVDKVMSWGERLSQGVGSLSTQVEAGAGGEPDPDTLHAALGTREPRGAVNKVFALFHPEVWLEDQGIP